VDGHEEHDTAQADVHGADNIEHVTTYWVLWQKFHSPALAGFEVISHWVPFLLFSVYFGSLADRHDCRRLIQAAQALFMLFFALTSSYLLALALLLIGGIANLASMSIGQTIVQLLAPPAGRGRIIGLYGVSANGLRAGSGFTVGILGAAVGIHWSLGLSSVALCLGTLAAGIYALRDPLPDACWTH
jgi:MFS family permease